MKKLWKYEGHCKRCGVEYHNRDKPHKCIEITCWNCGFFGPLVYNKKLEGFTFSYTEPDYHDAWKCSKCGETSTGLGGKIPSISGISLQPIQVIHSGELFGYNRAEPKKCPKCGYEFK